MNEKKTLLCVKIIVIVFSVISLILFFLNESFDLGSKINSDKFGAFGSFYGGALSIIIVYLLYITYQKQNKQYIIAKKDSKFELITNLYGEILKDIESVKYKNSFGIQAIYDFDRAHWKKPNSVVNHLVSINSSIINLLDLINSDNILDKNVKEVLLTKTYFLYICKITAPVLEWYYKKLFEDDEKMGYKNLYEHPDTEIMIERYKELTKSGYNHLLEKGFLKLPKDKVLLNILNE